MRRAVITIWGGALSSKIFVSGVGSGVLTSYLDLCMGKRRRLRF